MSADHVRIKATTNNMYTHNTWGAGGCDDVCIALHHLVGGEWPHGLRRAGVVVVNEGHPPSRATTPSRRGPSPVDAEMVKYLKFNLDYLRIGS